MQRLGFWAFVGGFFAFSTGTRDGTIAGLLLIGLAIYTWWPKDGLPRRRAPSNETEAAEALQTIRNFLINARVNYATNEAIIKGLGYMMAAAMIRADGDVRREELLIATRIGNDLFDGFSKEEFERIVWSQAYLPEVSVFGDVVRLLGEETKRQLSKYLHAIANADGDFSEDEQNYLRRLEIAWSVFAPIRG